MFVLNDKAVFQVTFLFALIRELQVEIFDSGLVVVDSGGLVVVDSGLVVGPVK